MKAILASLPILLFACASTEPQELVNARSAYDRASHGPAAALAPSDVHAAQEALARAQQSFEDHGDGWQTKDLAYAAERRALLAEARARVVAFQEEATKSKAALDQLREQQVKTTSAELSVAEQQMAAQRQALADAQQRARQAAADLARIASVKQEPRGMVITLPGSVLFETAKSDLLPQAQAKLSEVADVLTRQDPDSTIVVQGYTDSQGSPSFNQELSQRRAESVRGYLVGHGIAPDRITAQGFGPSNPVADNASPEGRADNRRVEIVVQPKHASSTTP